MIINGTKLKSDGEYEYILNHEVTQKEGKIIYWRDFDEDKVTWEVLRVKIEKIK